MLVNPENLYHKTKLHRCAVCNEYIYKYELDQVVITKTKRRNIVMIHDRCLGGANAKPRTS